MRTFFAAAALGLAFAAPASGTTYAIDPTHTFVTYEIGHFGTSTNRGRFDRKEGTVQFDRAAKTGKVEISFDLNAISTGVPMLDKHLQGADFFDTARHPSARFVGDKFTFSGDKVTQVAGTLTMLGKSVPVTLKATQFNCYISPMLRREVCGGDFPATIKRSQWGTNWGLEAACPEVRLPIQVEAIKQ